jgi:hypothetical protein
VEIFTDVAALISEELRKIGYNLVQGTADADLIVEASGDRERIFEGRVQSTGQQNRLPEVMPYLITAMFSNFPGENGVTKMVTIETDQ